MWMYDYKNSPEPDLIRRAKWGDIKAFSEMYERIYKDLYKFALYMTKHTQDAEDAVSESVLSAYENLSHLRNNDSFRSWMFTILNNRCKKILCRGRKEADRLDDSAHSWTGESAHEPDYAQWHDVRRAFGELDEEERMIVALSVFGGYRSGEIARMMDRNAATVRSRKRRALEKMRSSLG